MKHLESLQPGQGAPQLGATHGENAGLPFLGSGSEAGRAALAKFEKAGNVEENPAEMGGGVGPVDEYFAKIETASQEQVAKFLEWADQQKTAGVSRVNIGGVTVPLVEYKLRMTQVLAKKQASSPDRQPIGQPVDWKSSFAQDQRQRLQAFETKIVGFEQGQLQMVSNRLKELQAQALTDGWQSKEIKEEDVNICLRLIEEKVNSNVISAEDLRFNKMIKTARVTGWRPSPDELDPKIDLSGGGANGATEKGK